MSSAFHEFDPEGDVILILKNPGAPFAPDETRNASKYLVQEEGSSSQEEAAEEDWAPWGKESYGDTPSYSLLDPGNDPIDGPVKSPQPVPEDEPFTEDEAPIEEKGTIDLTSDSEHQSHLGSDTRATNDQGDEIRMRLSSKHLKLASPYFEKMLCGHWGESKTSPGSLHTIETSDWDPEALLILLNIIHGRTRRVPRSLSLEMFAKVAVLVDYYECHEVVELWSDYWIQSLVTDIPTEYCRDLVLWIAISWVYSDEEIFRTTTKVAIAKSDEPFSTLGLPIPQSIIEAIDAKRQEVVGQIISGLHKLVSYLLERRKCSFDCSALLIGALTKQMHENGLLFPKPKAPFIGYSVNNITKSVRSFKSASLGRDYWGTPQCRSDECTLVAFMGPTVNSFGDGIEGLALGSFKS